jgi:hypothetical protein
MSRVGCRQDGRLEFRLGPAAGPAQSGVAAEDFVRPPAADGARVSAVFDQMCVSERSWQAARDRLDTQRDRDSLRNPTQVRMAPPPPQWLRIRIRDPVPFLTPGSGTRDG